MHAGSGGFWPAHYRHFGIQPRRRVIPGTAIFTKERPLKVTPHIGIAEHDNEGRVLTAEYKDFFLVNVYTPNSKRESVAHPEKLEEKP